MLLTDKEYLDEHGKDIFISKGALLNITGLVERASCKNIIIAADKSTEPLAGQKLLNLLQGCHAISRTEMFVYDDDKLVPDESAIGKLLIAAKPEVDLIIALGSGTLNDICRYVSHRLHIPYIIVATAPSMDGYASSVSPLIVDGLKTTFHSSQPYGIICDTDILKTADISMIGAGVGDILGKYSCLCDWRLGHLVNGEAYSEAIADITRKSIEGCMEVISGLSTKNDDAIINLTRALILSGIAMKLFGSSRPASGSEHHLSHFWEMIFLFQGRPAIPHGTKVGIASLVIKKLHDLLLNEAICWDKIIDNHKAITGFEYEQSIYRVFGKAAPMIIKDEKKGRRNAAVLERIKLYKEKWPQIIELIRLGVPCLEYMENVLMSIAVPLSPRSIGIDRQTFIDSILYAKEIRSRFTVLQIISDLGLLSSYAEKLADEYYI